MRDRLLRTLFMSFFCIVCITLLPVAQTGMSMNYKNWQKQLHNSAQETKRDTIDVSLIPSFFIERPWSWWDSLVTSFSTYITSKRQIASDSSDLQQKFNQYFSGVSDRRPVDSSDADLKISDLGSGLENSAVVEMSELMEDAEQAPKYIESASNLIADGPLKSSKSYDVDVVSSAEPQAFRFQTNSGASLKEVSTSEHVQGAASQENTEILSDHIELYVQPVSGNDQLADASITMIHADEPLDPSDFPTESDYVAAVRALVDMPGTGVHSVDEAMATEHSATFALVTRSEATHVAVSNGSWFDPATWYEGKIPGEGAKVLIPEALAVTYDGQSVASLFTLRVDGHLSFSTDRDTFMEVDTLVVSRSGHLEIGTAKNPVAGGATTHIQIANNGPIDINWDPLLLSRGIISHGQLDIHGVPKDSHVKLEIDAISGDTTLTLASTPYGWTVGDTIVLTGTRIDPANYYTPTNEIESRQTEDEIFTIVEISENTITLDRPVTYDHDTPDPSLKASVANFSRNVSISTEGGQDTAVSERGHVMFMHSADVSVRYAEFMDLGRTDKSVRAFDVQDVTDVVSETNIKGRYALHLHKTGVSNTDESAIVEGNSVWGSPGWGIVQHESKANIVNNATFNTFGAGFVAEAGNETGKWTNNIAIKAKGVLTQDKDVADVEAFDLGRTGVGFWFQGRLIDAEDNIAAGVNRGYFYFHRGQDTLINPDQVDQPEILRNISTDVNFAPIQHFSNNEVYAAIAGLLITKAGPNQNHDVRSVFEGFNAWEVFQGIAAEYTSRYTFKDINIIGSINGAQAGVIFGNNSFDLVLNGAEISGFESGIVLIRPVLMPDIVGNQNFVFVDTNLNNILTSDFVNFEEGKDLIIGKNDLVDNRLNLFIDRDNLPKFSWINDQFSIDGTKVDSIGEVPHSMASDHFRMYAGMLSSHIKNEGYYEDKNGKKIIVIEEYFSDRATGEMDKIGIPVLVEDLEVFENAYGARYLGEIDLALPAPVASDDAVSLIGERQHVFDVTSNDLSLDGSEIKIDGHTQPDHGSVTILNDGTVMYRPDHMYYGRDKFDYWITTGQGSFDKGTVNLTIEQPPFATDGGRPVTSNTDYSIFNDLDF